MDTFSTLLEKRGAKDEDVISASRDGDLREESANSSTVDPR